MTISQRAPASRAVVSGKSVAARDMGWGQSYSHLRITRFSVSVWLYSCRTWQRSSRPSSQREMLVQQITESFMGAMMWWLEEGAGFDAMQSLKNPGIATALGAAILFGASAPLAKLLLEGAAPQLLAGLFYLGSGVGLSVVWLRRRQSADVAREKPLTRHDLPWLTGAIVFGGAVAPLLLMTGLARTPA